MNSPEPSSNRPASALDWAREIGEADRVMRDLETLVRRRRRRRVAGLASLAALLAVAAVVWLPRPAGPAAAPAVAAVGPVLLRPEQRTLPDGSRVELRDGARIAADFTGPLRRVSLEAGEAHFQVARDPARPFVVAVGPVEVRAVGTAFTLQRTAAHVDILVTAGRVAVSTQAAPAADPGRARTSEVLLDTGHRTSVALAPGADGAPAVEVVPATELSERLAWRRPRLELNGTPLAQALPLFNEHCHPQLALGDPALGSLRISGVLRADNTDSLLRLLEGEFGLRAERQGDVLVLRR